MSECLLYYIKEGATRSVSFPVPIPVMLPNKYYIVASLLLTLVLTGLVRAGTSS